METVYRSTVRVETGKDLARKVWLPAESRPVIFGIHAAVAKFYDLSSEAYEPHAATLDYVVAAVAAGLTGSYSAILQSNGIKADHGALTAEATGDIAVEEGVLVIRRVRVAMQLNTPEKNRETARRLFASFEQHSPAYRTLHRSFEITSELNFA